MAQAIEAYWNKNATNQSDEYALKAIACLWAELPKAVSSPTPDLRARIMEGAFFAGKAINITKTTAPHAVSYPYTAYYNYSHGHAVALNFSKIAAYNVMHGSLSTHKKEYLKELFKGYTESEISNSLSSYIQSLGLGRKDLDEPYDLELILANVNLNRLANNPAEFSKDILSDYLLN